MGATAVGPIHASGAVRSLGVMAFTYVYTACWTAVLGVLAAAPGLWRMACAVAGPAARSAPRQRRRLTAAGRGGAVSEHLLEHLSKVVAVIVPLVTAALVSIAFSHETLRGVPSDAVWQPGAAGRFLDDRNAAVNLICAGTAGLVFAAAGFVLQARRPTGRARTALLDRSARWCARAAGWAAAATVMSVPGLLALLQSALLAPK